MISFSNCFDIRSHPFSSLFSTIDETYGSNMFCCILCSLLFPFQKFCLLDQLSIVYLQDIPRMVI